jgi:hypothetical protein
VKFKHTWGRGKENNPEIVLGKHFSNLHFAHADAPWLLGNLVHPNEIRNHIKELGFKNVKMLFKTMGSSYGTLHIMIGRDFVKTIQIIGEKNENVGTKRLIEMFKLFGPRKFEVLLADFDPLEVYNNRQLIKKIAGKVDEFELVDTLQNHHKLKLR